MEDRPPSVTEAEFASLARHAGLTLSDAQRETLYRVYGHFEHMRTLVRGERARAAEPAHVFVPGQEWERP
jgi:hypothetical protein